ncbi:DEAD/DEAH box helicase [Clavibacter michiganensis]|uniref:DEAD/DEAH box helicase n=2 Tax=Clavibacter michiganensis TaxID=28447 RepID=UPI0013661B3A|nr:DEAD/DEAH box helicase [Clavibacter michiganensis]MDO4065959.1 DEAD/DEAH box helicase [Clavibacter michiganensis]MDO4072007.1 DEAD/DEAH box helicase [Clavibacter michiganensis]MDO4090225.1 DEAD/DEAH box helicase [Clavibacter michiganensis]MWJ04103.1 ATP-dependent helicase [Clavibacter michiganensis subsp. michiganensis]MWJ08474.1 ATP-dependent helicase [Clavibacter michiganensis subsp. michiganensis]
MPYNNDSPRGAKRAPAGSRSPNHRGYNSDPAPKKQRWNADERAQRSGQDDRPQRGGAARPARGGDRPNWEPRAERPAGRGERPAYGDRPNRANARPERGDARPQRGERPSYGGGNDRGQRSERPSYGAERGQRSERPSYGNSRPDRGGERSERPSYNDRAPRNDRPSYGNDRPQRSERPAYNDRPARSERPSYNDRAERPSYNDRNARTERPAYNDRPARGERPSYNDSRPARTERPSYNDSRPARTERPSYGDRAERSERPSYNDRPARTERPSYNDRPQRSERPSYGDRPQRSERPSYDDARPKRDSDFYPSKEGAPRHAPAEDVVLERLEAQATTAKDVDGVTFAALGLGQNIVRVLEELGAASPFPIQAATIPDVLAGRDVLGRGRTGSGKTIAFGAPLVERLLENDGAKNRKMGRKPRALILAPTRELAMQIDRTVQPIARSVGLFTTTIFGGVPQFKQVGALQRGVDILIATPGRLEDLIDQGRLDLSEIVVTVLDEADHMCDLGFLEPVQRILRQVKKDGQRLLFSATLDKGVATLVNEFLPNPSVHEVAGEDQASSTIDHRVLLIEQRDKAAIIEQLSSGEGKTLIFARTRAFAEQLADQLEDAGIPATSLHGDLNQARRTRNLQLLTSGKVRVLVATDVAARGIHVDDIGLVIQADAPDEYKSYLHRAGRTGRAGKQGTVVTLITKARRRRMDDLLGRAEIKATTVMAAAGDRVIADLARV